MNTKSKLSVRTRFAPSPTGDLHLGGVRTALFNYLLAKKHNGQFILRVEDTDLERNQPEKGKEQYQNLLWLGLKPDEDPINSGPCGPYQQTLRLNTYRQYVNQLLKEKKAYYCFCSKEELEKEKKEYLKKEKRANYQYSRKCLKLEPKLIESLLTSQKDYLIRLEVPAGKFYNFTDLVRGNISFQSKDIEDFVLFRSNGIPNYNFACVIDDCLMKISHVLRGEEHLSNTPKQLALYEAFQWEFPSFGHLSIILNKEGKKLSKRDKGKWNLINQLKISGYLPQAIINYLLFLGWKPKGTQEIFPLKEAIEEFSLEGLNARAAAFSLEKLNWYNNYYIQQLTEEEFNNYSWERLSKHYQLFDEQKEYSQKIAQLFRSQLNYFQELTNLTNYFFQKPNIALDLNNEQVNWLNSLALKLKVQNNWEEKLIKETLQNSILEKERKKEWFLLVRNKLTGKSTGPELPKIIFLLGKEKTLQYLE